MTEEGEVAMCGYINWLVVIGRDKGSAYER